MKHFFYILLFTGNSLQLFAQEEVKFLNTLCESFDYVVLEKGLNDQLNKSTDETKFLWRTILERELIKGYFEQIITFRTDIRNQKNDVLTKTYEHTIELIRKGRNDIIFYRIFHPKNSYPTKKDLCQDVSIQKTKSRKFNRFKTNYQKTYGQVLNKNDLFKTNIIYGIKCGRVRSSPSHRSKMLEFVKKKDTTALFNWLKSGTVELQLYAIDGIFTLRDHGSTFDQNVYNLIELIGNKMGKAKTCFQCSMLDKPIINMVESIKQRHTFSHKKL